MLLLKKSKNINDLWVMNKSEEIIFLSNIVISLGGNWMIQETLEWLDIWQNTTVSTYSSSHQGDRG